MAEILITLSIIGVVAALTIPSLIANYREKQTVIQVKKVYTTLNEALNLTRVEYGPYESWGLDHWTTGPQGALKLYEMAGKHFNIIKYCANKIDGCFSEDFRNTNDIGSQNAIKIMLADSTSINIMIHSSNCGWIVGTSEPLKHICGHFDVDINGPSIPNKRGRDIFSFWFTKYGVLPKGDANSTMYTLSNCLTSGDGCTAWVIYQENMNYLKGPVCWDK